MESKIIIHLIEPLYNAQSKTLILGSFPSVKSREEGFFYGNPQNRFWKVIAEVYSRPVPQSIAEKKSLILENGLALYDAVYACEIKGSSDASIKIIKAADISAIIAKSKIDRIILNGRTAAGIYEKHIFPETGIKGEILPSTSPANAAFSFAELLTFWKKIK